MEEFLLGAFFLRQKLDIVHQQHIHVPKLVAEAGHLVVAQRVNHFIGELLAGEIANGDLRRPLLDFVADGLHQVGLTHADPAV